MGFIDLMKKAKLPNSNEWISDLADISKDTNVQTDFVMGNGEKKFDLNIEKILDNWDVFHAIREIIANALDEQILTKTKDIAIYKSNDNCWHIVDYGRGLNYHHLTQNENEEKINNDNLIGRFGVGLKDALATLYRNNINVEITSKFGIITLNQSVKSGFDDILTLHAKITPPKDINMIGTDFCLSGCSDEDIEKAKALFLKFSNDEVLEETVYGQVIENNSDFANIYINGVKVAEETNFLFSYNITSLTTKLKKALNRERSNVGRTAYTDRIKAILLECKSTVVIKNLIDDLQQFSSGLKHDELDWQDVQLYASQQLKLQDSTSTFVTSDDLMQAPNIIDEMERDGYTPIVIPEKLADKMETHNKNATDDETFITIDQFIINKKSEFNPVIINKRDFTDAEKIVYSKTAQILDLIGGLPKQVEKIRITENIYETDVFSETVGLWQPQEHRILIKRKQLRSVQDYAGTLLHECVHAMSGFSDVNRDFESALTKTIGEIVARILD